MTATGRTRAGAAADAKSPSAPRRGRKPGHRVVGVRFSYPVADTSVAAWLASQDSVSESLRVLIRESIERDGYIDLANRPLTQQPRKGRPPLELPAVAPVAPASPDVSDDRGRSDGPGDLPEPGPQHHDAGPAAPDAPSPDPVDGGHQIDAQLNGVSAASGGVSGDDDDSGSPHPDDGDQFSVDAINDLLRSSR